jgi:endogenous inhibitor of DNA gyrase (YacG/DUF329 family)
MICEYCNNKITSDYRKSKRSKKELQRFCSKRCAKGFSSKEKRQDINERVSKSLKGRECWVPKEKRKTHIFTYEELKRGGITKALRNRIRNKDLLGKGLLTKSKAIRPLLIEYQNNKCAICGNENVWNGKELIFDVDHINGDSSDFSRENLRAICPNCHRQTETFGGRNANKGHAREYLKKYLSYKERQKILMSKRLKEII